MEQSGKDPAFTVTLRSQLGNFGGACVGFWYHMYGSHVGTLSLLAYDNQGVVSEVWKKLKEGSMYATRSSFYVDFAYLNNKDLLIK